MGDVFSYLMVSCAYSSFSALGIRSWQDRLARVCCLTKVWLMCSNNDLDQEKMGCHLLKLLRITRSQLTSYIVRTIEWVHKRGSYLRFIAIRQFPTQKKKKQHEPLVLPSLNWQETTIINNNIPNFVKMTAFRLLDAFCIWIVTHLGFVSKIKSQNHLIQGKIIEGKIFLSRNKYFVLRANHKEHLEGQLVDFN